MILSLKNLAAMDEEILTVFSTHMTCSRKRLGVAVRGRVRHVRPMKKKSFTI